MPFSPPLHVPDIFSVCPLHLPCMSRSFVASHFPTSPVVLGFLVLCFLSFPLHSPLFSFLSLACPFQFPFVSLSCPAAFLSCRLPISSPHFTCTSLHFPSAPQYFQQKTRFSSVFTIRTSKNTEFFPDFLQKEAGTPNQQRAGRGNRAWDPCFATPRRLRLVERHQIAARPPPPPHPPPPTYQTSGGGGVRGGVILYTPNNVGGHKCVCIVCEFQRLYITLSCLSIPILAPSRCFNFLGMQPQFTTTRISFVYGSKLNLDQGTAGFPWFHLPGQPNFGLLEF